MPTNSVASNALRGGLAGAVATLGMTAAMAFMHRRLPARQRYGLPPEQIVGEVLEQTDGHDHLSQRQFESLAMVAHHAYGTGMGAVYGVVAPHVRSTPVASGVSFGLTVWAVGYLGWLPALRMEASATREPAERNALTIAAHLLWGAATGVLTAQADALTNRRRRRRKTAIRGGDWTHAGSDGYQVRSPFPVR